MSWILLTILSVIAVAFADILQRVLMKSDSSNPYAYGIVFHFLLALASLMCQLWYGSSFSLSNGNFLLVLLISALWAATTVFYFKALQLIEVSEVKIISTLQVLVTILASVFLLDEVFNLLNAFGAFIIVVATILVINVRGGFKLNKGVVYTLLMSLFSGLALVIDSMNVRHYDVVAYNTVQNFLTGFILFLIYPKFVYQWRGLIAFDFLKKMFPLVLLSTMQGLLYLQALTFTGYTAQIGAIRQSSLVVTVVLSAIFLKDRACLTKKLFAAILICIGVMFLR